MSVPFLHLMSNSDKARFWAKVDRLTALECWNWTAAISKNGYGSFGLNGGRLTSSRVAYALGWWQDPGDQMVLHKCDNRRCCNPDHLYLGDVKQNARDMVERGRHRAAPAVGSQNGYAKLTESDVVLIRQMIADGKTNIAIAPVFGVTHQMISKIRRGHFWKHVGVSGEFHGKNENGPESSQETMPESEPDQEVKWSERWESNPRPLTPQKTADQ